MCVLSAHMVRYDNDLENVSIDGFPSSLKAVNRILYASTSNSQAIAVFVGFRRNVKGDPPIGFVQSNDTDVLKITDTSTSTNGQSGRCVRVVLRMAQVDTQFLHRVDIVYQYAVASSKQYTPEPQPFD
jgi:hypothetical protein